MPFSMLSAFYRVSGQVQDVEIISLESDFSITEEAMVLLNQKQKCVRGTKTQVMDLGLKTGFSDSKASVFKSLGSIASIFNYRKILKSIIVYPYKGNLCSYKSSVTEVLLFVLKERQAIIFEKETDCNLECLL